MEYQYTDWVDGSKHPLNWVEYRMMNIFIVLYSRSHYHVPEQPSSENVYECVQWESAILMGGSSVRN